MDKIWYAVKGVNDLVTEIKRRYGTSIIENIEVVERITRYEEMTQNDQRLKQIIFIMKSHFPETLGKLLAKLILKKKLIIKTKKEVKMRKNSDITRRKKLKAWKQFPINNEYHFETAKTFCKLCKDYYPSLNKEIHMQNCEGILRIKERLYNANAVLFNYSAEFSKEILEMDNETTKKRRRSLMKNNSFPDRRASCRERVYVLV